MYKVITDLDYEPVSIGEVKIHLRLTDDTTEDDMLLSLISAAREWCESYIGRALGVKTLELLLDDFPASDVLCLPCPPLVSVTSIKYRDSSGTETTMSAADYIVDIDRDPGRVVLAYGKSWPSFTAYPSNPIRVRYVTGYAIVPLTIKQAMLLLIGHWYENREALVIGSISKPLEFAVRALLMPHKVRWF